MQLNMFGCSLNCFDTVGRQLSVYAMESPHQTRETRKYMVISTQILV